MAKADKEAKDAAAEARDPMGLDRGRDRVGDFAEATDSMAIHLLCEEPVYRLASNLTARKRKHSSTSWKLSPKSRPHVGGAFI